MIVQDFFFGKCRGGICRVSKWIVNNVISLQLWCCLVFIFEDNNIFGNEVGRVFWNIWVFKDLWSMDIIRTIQFFNYDVF